MESKLLLERMAEISASAAYDPKRVDPVENSEKAKAGSPKNERPCGGGKSALNQFMDRPQNPVDEIGIRSFPNQSVSQRPWLHGDT